MCTKQTGWKTRRSVAWLHYVAMAAAIGVGMSASVAWGQENLTLWRKMMPMTFNGYEGEETLTNFPALVVLSNTPAGAGFNYTDFQSPPYGDLRFAAADKTTPLDFEVESWNTDGVV